MNDVSKTTEELLGLLRSLSSGTVFSVTFVTRTGGNLRQMNCRLDVKKGTTGVGLNYNPFEKGLLSVYDMGKRGFRMIPIEGIRSLTIKGKRYVVG